MFSRAYIILLLHIRSDRNTPENTVMILGLWSVWDLNRPRRMTNGNTLLL